MLLSVAVLAVRAHAQQTVGGLVIGQTYDYDYIISELGEPDYVSHDMYEFLVYKEKRLSAPVPWLTILRSALSKRSLKRICLGLLQELMDGVIFRIILVQTDIHFPIRHCLE